MNWLWLILHIVAIAGVGKAAWTIIPVIWFDWPGETIVVACGLVIFGLECVSATLKLFVEILERKIADLDKASTGKKR